MPPIHINSLAKILSIKEDEPERRGGSGDGPHSKITSCRNSGEAVGQPLDGGTDHAFRHPPADLVPGVLRPRRGWTRALFRSTVPSGQGAREPGRGGGGRARPTFRAGRRRAAAATTWSARQSAPASSGGPARRRSTSWGRWRWSSSSRVSQTSEGRAGAPVSLLPGLERVHLLEPQPRLGKRPGLVPEPVLPSGDRGAGETVAPTVSCSRESTAEGPGSSCSCRISPVSATRCSIRMPGDSSTGLSLQHRAARPGAGHPRGALL